MALTLYLISDRFLCILFGRENSHYSGRLRRSDLRGLSSIDLGLLIWRGTFAFPGTWGWWL